MVRWVVGSILHGVDPFIYFSFQPMLHDWFNKGCGMCYPVCGMVHIKEPLLIRRSSPCGSSRVPLSISRYEFFFFFNQVIYVCIYMDVCTQRNILVNIAVAISAKVLFFFLISLSK